MLTSNDFENWEKAKAMADSLKKEIGNKLRHIWQEYQQCYTGDGQFPTHGITKIDIYNDYIHISGWCDPDPDLHGCSIPVDFAFSDAETRAKIVREKLREINAEKENDARLKEEKERAEYERLQAKFGSGS